MHADFWFFEPPGLIALRVDPKDALGSVNADGIELGQQFGCDNQLAEAWPAHLTSNAATTRY